MLSPYLLGAIVAVGIWGTTGIIKGTKWTFHHAKCVATLGVKGCKAKTPAPVPAVAPTGAVSLVDATTAEVKQ